MIKLNALDMICKLVLTLPDVYAKTEYLVSPIWNPYYHFFERELNRRFWVNFKKSNMISNLWKTVFRSRLPPFFQLESFWRYKAKKMHLLPRSWTRFGHFGLFWPNLSNCCTVWAPLGGNSSLAPPSTTLRAFSNFWQRQPNHLV